MKYAYLLFIVLYAASLACGGTYLATPAPTVTPTETATAISTQAVTPTATATPQIVPSASSQSQTASIVEPSVNLRRVPGGEVLAPLFAGDTVNVLSCGIDKSSDDYNWCRVSTLEHTGYIWRGCISDNPDNLGCEAR